MNTNKHETTRWFFIVSMWRVHFSGISWFFWKVLRGPQKIVSRTPVWEPLG